MSQSKPREYVIASIDPRLQPIVFKSIEDAEAHGWSKENLTVVVDKLAHAQLMEAAEALAEALKTVLPQTHGLVSMMYSQDYSEQGPPQFLIDAQVSLEKFEAFKKAGGK